MTFPTEEFQIQESFVCCQKKLLKSLHDLYKVSGTVGRKLLGGCLLYYFIWFHIKFMSSLHTRCCYARLLKN